MYHVALIHGPCGMSDQTRNTSSFALTLQHFVRVDDDVVTCAETQHNVDDDHRVSALGPEKQNLCPARLYSIKTRKDSLSL